MEKKAGKVVVGGVGRGVLLTTENIYNVAHGLAVVELDSAALDRIARGKPNEAVLGEAELRRRVQRQGADDGLGVTTDSDVPEAVTRGRPGIGDGDGGSEICEERARADLVVVLHKLLNGPNCIRAFVPKFIALVLNLKMDLSFLDRRFGDDLERVGVLILTVMEMQSAEKGDANGTAAMKVFHVGRLTGALEGAGAGELGLTAEECGALENSIMGMVGGEALASHALDSLTGLADAVVALSCEALQADTAALDSVALKQASLPKSDVEVAADLTCLLSGSKLVKARKGGADATFVRDVPAVHGALRNAAKTFATTLRMEINRVPDSASTPMHPAPRLAIDAIATTVGLSHAIVGSEGRAGEINNVRDFGPPSETRKVPSWDWDRVVAVREWKEALMLPSWDWDRIGAVREWREALAKEGAAALALLEVKERSVAGSDENLDAAAGGKARAKQRKTFVLGKGTDEVRRLLTSHVVGPHADVVALEKALVAVLHPHVPACEALVAAVKRVLESNESRRLPKTAKGTRDFKPEQMVIREKAFGIIATVFKRHGAVALDTPVFELRETLMGKYGEDSKLIYDLADQGGEMLSLRYDLTVPLARYLATNKVESLKRYHIAKVYRRDNPAKGRYREFYQCDVDIAGRYPLMFPDFEILKVLTEVLDELAIGTYEVKLNHRVLLDGMLDICGVPETKFRSICSAIDKLDKLPWEKVRKEMVEEKGLTPETADGIGKLVQKRGQPFELLAELTESDSLLLLHAGASTALEELGVLFRYLKAAKCVDRIVFDLSLARGLDYYTGVIYEAVFKGSTQVGSIAAGGRYDNLVGQFSGKQVPAVGVSLGIERILTIMEEKMTEISSTQVKVWVLVLDMSVEGAEQAIGIVNELWEGKITAEFKCIKGAHLTKQINVAVATGIPWLVIAGEDEFKTGIVLLKNVTLNQQEHIRREELVTELSRRLGTTTPDLPPYIA